MVESTGKIVGVSRLAGLFQDPLRVRLFLSIVRLSRKKRWLCVSELAKDLGSSLSNTSHQLRKLELAGLIEGVRRGRMICYKILKTRRNELLYTCLIRLLKAQS